jgi:signal transduction histidine kinase
LQNQKLRLERLNEEKNDLMSIVAHDLKSPLAQIKGLISIHELEGYEKTKDQDELLDKIKRVTEEQNKQISDFLNAKSIEIQHNEIGQELLVQPTIEKAITEILPQAKAKGIKITSSFLQDDLKTNGCEKGLFKVISNLVSNAIKFSNANTEVRIEVKENQSNLLIMIQDEGQGFSKEDLPHIFKKHKTLSATPTNNEISSGMGLYIVKKYVALLRGEVWVESEEGNGSTFFIKLPKH